METGLFGALIGAAANVGMGLYNNHYNAKQARVSDERQYRYWRKMQEYSLLHGPSLTRQGLEAAGYNPMLALGHLGSSVASPSAHSSTSNLSFDGSSAASLGKFFQDLALKSEKAKVENIKADTDLKEAQMDAVETQRLQDEAQTTLIQSQTERSDLAYGRDIVGTVADIAGTAGSLYSAKAMSDVAKANAATAARNATVNERRLDTNTIEGSRNAKGRKVGEIERTHMSLGKPTVNNSAKAPTPNVGGLGHSAKSVGKVAKDIAHSLLYLPFLAPVGVAALGAAEGFLADDKSTYKRMEKAKEKSYWSNLSLR